MCLLIRNPPAYTVVYKVYKLNTLYANGRMTLSSVYQQAKYHKVGTNSIIVSDRTSKDLTAYEKQDSQVHNGLHAFTALEDAKNFAQSMWARTAVVQMTGLHDDFVAAGVWSDSPQPPCVVYTRLIVDKILHIYSRQKLVS